MTITDAIASIVAFFLPRRVKYYAMLDWIDWFPAEAAPMTIDCPRYRSQITKELK
jgi:hypothetical protein